MKKSLLTLFLIFLSACSTVPQELSSKPYYKRDIKICENEKCFDGVAVLPSKSSYDLKFQLKGKADLFTLQTCSRNIDQEDAWIRSWLPDKYKVEYFYMPMKIEREMGCAVVIGGYEKILGRHSWGMIIFEDPIYRLRARTFCNGVVNDFNGTSICQSQAGLYQEVHVPQGAIVKKEKRCPDMIEVKPGEFRHEMGLRECVYTFGKDDQYHKYITVGYENILIRGI